MKNYSLLITLVVCCAFGLMLSACTHMPTPDRDVTATNAQPGKRSLTNEQLEAIVKPRLEHCQTNNRRINAASIIPTNDAREFSTGRIAKTLHGIWQGVVVGDPGDVGIDYFWIMDTENNEGLLIALRNGVTTVPRPLDTATTPKLTFVLCANAGYTPSKDTPMIHEFVKVDDHIEDAAQIVERGTGLRLSKARPSISDLWQGLLESKYFESMPAMAFAGALFKPIRIGHAANVTGPAGLALSWDSEYRGGGTTSIKYTTGVPMIGIEHGEFVGTTTSSGDYLVSSPGNGKIWKVEASMLETEDTISDERRGTFPVICYDLVFDKVVLGPLEPEPSMTRK